MPLDSAYAGVMTSALLIRDEDRDYILEPGFAVRSVVPVYTAEDDLCNNRDTAYAVSREGDSLLRLCMPAKDGRVREIHFQRLSLENADESMQKNWLRSRVRYKLCRRRPDGVKDSIDYHFASDRFHVKLGSTGVMANSLTPIDTEYFLHEYRCDIVEAFSSEYIVTGLRRFIDNRQRVADELLIPSIRRGVVCGK